MIFCKWNIRVIFLKTYSAALVNGNLFVAVIHEVVFTNNSIGQLKDLILLELTFEPLYHLTKHCTLYCSSFVSYQHVHQT